MSFHSLNLSLIDFLPTFPMLNEVLMEREKYKYLCIIPNGKSYSVIRFINIILASVHPFSPHASLDKTCFRLN